MCTMEWKEVEPEQKDWKKQIDIVAYYGSVTIASIVYCGSEIGWKSVIDGNMEFMGAKSEEEAKKEIVNTLDNHCVDQINYYKELQESLCKLNTNMWTIEELLEMETPYLTMHDITDADWEKLDFELEKYDKANEDYPLNESKVLAFVLQQIHYNKMNFNEVPNLIRNGRQFQELVVKYNPELSHILFPTR